MNRRGFLKALAGVAAAAVVAPAVLFREEPMVKIGRGTVKSASATIPLDPLDYLPVPGHEAPIVLMRKHRGICKTQLQTEQMWRELLS